MVEQIHLDGFEQLHLVGQDYPGFFRRESDRQMAHSRFTDTAANKSSAVPFSTCSHPVIVYTLGRFSLLLDGRPADFGRKVPHRPLELLKAIIAHGGRDVSLSTLMADLWPDVDGDIAQRSIDTNLHRLRKILGDDYALVLNDRKLSLDAGYCWVDIWVFERLLGRVQRILKNDHSGQHVYSLQQLTIKLLGIYQDHFLAKEDPCAWSISIQETLRSKFIYCLLELGRYWESYGYWDMAIQCYQKGLAVDDLVEVFYQRLISCYLETQRYSEGMSVYRHCRTILSVVLGLQPEPATESLYSLLKNARAGQRSA